MENELTKSKEAFLDYLTNVYNQCNQHLLEQGKKRDQAITFYVVILAFIITYHSILEKQFWGSITMPILYAIISLIGIIVALTLADLRGWHQQYIDCILVINYIFSHQDNFETVTDIKNEIKILIKKNNSPQAINEKRKKFKLNLNLKSTDNMAFYGIILLTSLPILGIYTHFIPNNNLALSIFFYIITLVILFLGLEKYLESKIRSAKGYETWILDFSSYNNNDEKTESWSNEYFKININNNQPIISQKTGGVIVVAKIENKIIFLGIQRIDGSNRIEVPRGFLEKNDQDFIAAGIRELQEETGITAENIEKTQDLGATEPDSGLIKSNIHCVYLQLRSLPQKFNLQTDEQINRLILLDSNQINEYIRDKKIIDGFTLSAIAKTISNKMI